MRFFHTTAYHKKYWENRQIDWKKDYLSTWNHPHRYLISAILKTFSWMSLWEIGCGAGENLINILLNFKGKTIQLGGSDISADAIAAAKTALTGAILKVGPGDDVVMSDDSTDVTLTDRMLIYVGPRQIDAYIKEIKRITRSRVILCEFHCEKWHERLFLRWKTGYYAYNYRKLLDRHGFYDILQYKIPVEAWPGDTYPSYIIVARVAPRK